MRRFNLITNLTNGVGLQRDYEILRPILESAGHLVTGIDFRHVARLPAADVNLFLEVIVPSMLDAASQNWAIPNPEWWFDAYTLSLPRIDRVLCKTRHAHSLFRDLVGDRAQYVGFMSRDLLQSDVRRKPKFLHVAGNSSHKNTEVLLKAWKRLPFALTLVSAQASLRAQAAALNNVRVYDRVSDDKLRYLMNRHQFHLCPSAYEGFGHYIHEALGVGAVVLTLDAPPMNNLGLSAELLMAPVPAEQLRLARLHTVSRSAIVACVQQAAQLSPRRIQKLSTQARALFDQERAQFPARLLAAINA